MFFSTLVKLQIWIYSLKSFWTGSDLLLHALHWPHQVGDLKTVESRQEQGRQGRCKTMAVKYKGSFPHLVDNYWNNSQQHSLHLQTWHIHLCHSTQISAVLQPVSNFKTSLQLVVLSNMLVIFFNCRATWRMSTLDVYQHQLLKLGTLC